MKGKFKIDVNIDDEQIVVSPLGEGVNFLPLVSVPEIKETSGEDDRIKDIIDVQEINKKGIAVLGGGSVGSWVAFYLAPYLTRILLLDEDRVEPSNLKGRTVYLPSHVGQFKVYALEQILKSRNSNIEVETFVCNINQAPASLFQKLLQYDLIICAIDDIRALLRVNRLTYGRVRTLYPGVYQRGRSGFVVVVTEETACFKCAMQIGRDEQELEPLHRESALGLDITKISLTCAQLAIYMLLQDNSPEFSGVLELKKANLLWIHNRKGPMLGDAMENIWLPTKHQPGCNICGR